MTPSVDHYHLRLFTTIDVSKSSFPKSSISGATVCSVVPGKLSEYTHKTLDDGHEAYYACEPTLRANGYFVPDKSAPTTPDDSYRGPFFLTKGRRVLPRYINFELIQGWLQQCDHDHIESRPNRNTTHSAPLRCIDCFSREVVRLSPGADYVAPSYVWGGISTAGMLKREQGTGRLFVPEDVPQVIGDSIVVVKSIGKRYLWVDQCCIDQNDNADKMAQIQNMDNIYQGAYLTIVAAAGKDSTYGLPGVSWRPRREQLYVNIGSFALVGSLPTAHEVIRNSIWATRGWTYQETVLSRRLLIFTNYQAHLVCPAQIWCEDKALSRGSTGVISHEPVPVLSQIFETKRYRRGATDLRDAFRHFEQFSTRDLTYEGDALDAIRGLLSRCPFYTYYGVLLQRYESPEDTSQSRHRTTLPVEFFQSLWFFFEPSEGSFEVRRRPGFPSWSWLGWKAQKGVDYSKINPSLRNEEDSEYRLERKAIFWAEEHNGAHVQLVDLLLSPTPSASSSDSTRIIPELSMYLWWRIWCSNFSFRTTTRSGPIILMKGISR
ncbi:heterokaryon incompatibility protein-domain-containing protein [Neurospora tetraspora]|uniref:Heterokaryon incompatibility protein-domain-containing protein n=1 Tax=Neurospora tetraspora TaxID=94610 RepID=A0AAE0MQF0_9PEZI|nr:heterokaryon incompatibility protein-domain-containing protein [Neurospora tetraspora]